MAVSDSPPQPSMCPTYIRSKKLLAKIANCPMMAGIAMRRNSVGMGSVPRWLMSCR